MNNPTPTEIKTAREKCELTQSQAGEILHAGRSAWQKWELGQRKMHPAFWELFLIKTRK